MMPSISRTPAAIISLNHIQTPYITLAASVRLCLPTESARIVCVRRRGKGGRRGDAAHSRPLSPFRLAAHACSRTRSRKPSDERSPPDMEMRAATFSQRAHVCEIRRDTRHANFFPSPASAGNFVSRLRGGCAAAAVNGAGEALALRKR